MRVKATGYLEGRLVLEMDDETMDASVLAAAAANYSASLSVNGESIATSTAPALANAGLAEVHGRTDDEQPGGTVVNPTDRPGGSPAEPAEAAPTTASASDGGPAPAGVPAEALAAELNGPLVQALPVTLPPSVSVSTPSTIATGVAAATLKAPPQPKKRVRKPKPLAGDAPAAAAPPPAGAEGSSAAGAPAVPVVVKRKRVRKPKPLPVPPVAAGTPGAPLAGSAAGAIPSPLGLPSPLLAPATAAMAAAANGLLAHGAVAIAPAANGLHHSVGTPRTGGPPFDPAAVTAANVATGAGTPSRDPEATPVGLEHSGPGLPVIATNGVFGSSSVEGALPIANATSDPGMHLAFGIPSQGTAVAVEPGLQPPAPPPARKRQRKVKPTLPPAASDAAAVPGGVDAPAGSGPSDPAAAPLVKVRRKYTRRPKPPVDASGPPASSVARAQLESLAEAGVLVAMAAMVVGPGGAASPLPSILPRPAVLPLPSILPRPAVLTPGATALVPEPSALLPSGLAATVATSPASGGSNNSNPSVSAPAAFVPRVPRIPTSPIATKDVARVATADDTMAPLSPEPASPPKPADPPISVHVLAPFPAPWASADIQPRTKASVKLARQLRVVTSADESSGDGVPPTALSRSSSADKSPVSTSRDLSPVAHHGDSDRFAISTNADVAVWKTPADLAENPTGAAEPSTDAPGEPPPGIAPPPPWGAPATMAAPNGTFQGMSQTARRQGAAADVDPYPAVSWKHARGGCIRRFSQGPRRRRGPGSSGRAEPIELAPTRQSYTKPDAKPETPTNRHEEIR